MKHSLAIALVCASVSVEAAPLRIAVMPLGSENEGPLIERTLIEVIAEQPMLQLANVSATGSLIGLKNRSPELRGDPNPNARALALGKEVGAERVVSVEPVRLGDGLVLYLQATNVQSGKTVGSTTAALAAITRPLGAIERRELKAALMRTLDPEHYMGRLALHIDVAKAEVQIDGHTVKNAAPIELPVGTHALRVTHSAYQDYLRFIEIEFDRTLTLDVALSAYPRSEGRLVEREKKLPPEPNPPWYRRWWAITTFAVVLGVATFGLVYGLRPGLEGDRSVNYNPRVTP